MSSLEKRFAMEYLLDGNGTQAVIRAGYTGKSPRVKSCTLLKKKEVKDMIAELLAKEQSEKVASIGEVLEYVSSVMRGNSQSEVMVKEGTGSGTSQAVMKVKSPDERERMKAAEMLVKLYTAGSEPTVSVHIPIIIKEDLQN